MSIELFRRIYNGLVGVFSATFFVWFFIIPAPNAVLKAKRSKNGYKKLIRSFSLIDWLLKRKYLENTKVCHKYQKFFIVCNYILYLCVLVLFALYLISLFTHNFVQLIRAYIFVKGLLVEFPLIIFTLCNYRSVNTLRKKGYWICNWNFLLDYDTKAQRYYREYR